MKTPLFILFSFLSTLLFGQKHLKGRSTRNYDFINGNAGSVQLDSLSFIYNSNDGQLSEFAPVFNDFYWDDELPFPEFDELYRFWNSTTTPIDSSYSIKVDGKTNEIYGLFPDYFLPGNYHKFTWDNNNQLKSHVIGNQWNGVVTFILDSISYNYDIWGNQINQNRYSLNSGQAIHVETDTSFYVPGTSKKIKYIAFNKYWQAPVNGVFVPKRKLIYHYYNDNYNYVDDYQELSQNYELIFGRRLFFTHVDDNLIKVTEHSLINGVADFLPFAKQLYSYTSSGKVQMSEFYSNDELWRDFNFEYDVDDFLIKSTRRNYNSTSNANYSVKSSTYYFNEPLEIDEKDVIQFSVFPNPSAEGIYTVSSNEEILELNVYNSNGQLLLQQNGKHINLSHLPVGNYILRGRAENGNFEEKIIKK